MNSKKKLHIIGTPIGNLEDITIRALRYIFESDIILAEDTREYSKLKGLIKQRYKKMLEVVDINYEKKQKVISYREQNHKRVVAGILGLIAEGEVVSLVSDAGMPAISDPGYLLINDVLNAGFEVEVIPGPTSVETALLASGHPTDRYTFLGFLPRKKSKMLKLLELYINKNTVIVFESPFRVLKTLETIRESLGNNVKVSACAELTKKFEKVWRGDIDNVIDLLSNIKIKGEWVLVFRKDSETE